MITTTTYDLKNIMNAAWDYVREHCEWRSRVRELLSYGLEAAWKAAKAALAPAPAANPVQAIQSLKVSISRYANEYYGSKNELKFIAMGLREAGQDFAAQVCESVAKYRKCSEKQAYVIAAACIAANLNLSLGF